MSQHLTLSELNEQIKETLYEAFPATLWVIAEISELKVNKSGHCYLDLIEKQENEIIARMRAMIWSYTFRMLQPYFETTTNMPFTSGIKVLFQATVEFHTAYGISLNIKDIDPTYTVGDMVLQRQEVINRLKEKGVFDMNKELALPMVPQKIAIISSKTAAGYEDFMKQLNNNDFVFYTQLFEAYMQGSSAVPSIINALERIYQYEDFFDVVVIIRGGGAVAEMSCFDDYELAFNVTQFPIPIITGIGHEKDDSIVDFVAHTRMKTPTAVADFLINGISSFADKLVDFENRLTIEANETLQQQKAYLQELAESIHFSTLHFVTNQDKNLIRLGNNVHKDIKRFIYNENSKLAYIQHITDKNTLLNIAKQRSILNRYQKVLERVTKSSQDNRQEKLNRLTTKVENVSTYFLNHQKEKLHLHENTVRLLNPKNVLKRGYTISTVGNQVIKSIKDVRIDDNVTVHFKDGEVSTIVKNKKEYGKEDNDTTEL